MRDQRLHVQRTRGLKRGSRGKQGCVVRYRLTVLAQVVDCDPEPQDSPIDVLWGRVECFALVNINDSYIQACLELACRLLYRVGLDHMINLQGRFVEMMAKQLCVVRQIVYL
jgi:hypothetical protein